jgi:hypothetical protein
MCLHGQFVVPTWYNYVRSVLTPLPNYATRILPNLTLWRANGSRIEIHLERLCIMNSNIAHGSNSLPFHVLVETRILSQINFTQKPTLFTQRWVLSNGEIVRILQGRGAHTRIYPSGSFDLVCALVVTQHDVHGLAQDWIPRRTGQKGLEKVLLVLFEYRRKDNVVGQHDSLHGSHVIVHVEAAFEIQVSDPTNIGSKLSCFFVVEMLEQARLGLGNEIAAFGIREKIDRYVWMTDNAVVAGYFCYIVTNVMFTNFWIPCLAVNIDRVDKVLVKVWGFLVYENVVFIVEAEATRDPCCLYCWRCFFMLCFSSWHRQILIEPKERRERENNNQESHQWEDFLGRW